MGVVRRPKHKEPMFTIDERIGFLSESLADVDNVRYAEFSSLVVDIAAAEGAVALVKGLRAVSDYEWEFQMNHLNKELAPELETVYLMASSRYSFVSSSGVKEIAEFGGSVDEFVPPCVARAFDERRQAR